MWRMKKDWLERHKKALALLSIGLFVLVEAGLGFWLLQGQSTQVLANPIQGIAKERSLVKLTSKKEVVTSVPEGLPSQAEVTQEDEREQQESQAEGNQESQDKNDNGIKEEGTTSFNANADSGTSTTQSTQGNASGAGNESGQKGQDKNAAQEEREQDRKKLGKEGKKKNRYFTTSITDGATVTSREYSFTITHLDETLQVKDVTVLVNAEAFSYSGSVYLNAEKNSVEVRVTYQDEEGKLIEASKSYTIYLQIGNIRIYANIQDQEVRTREDFDFTAYAMLDGVEVPLKVTMNGEEISSGSQQYQVRLKEGENHIHLEAESQGKKASATYSVYYEKPMTELTIDTDLCDQEVNQPEFSFYAKAYQGSEEASLQVFAGGEELIGEEGGNYSLALQEGENVIRLLAKKGEDAYEETYTVTYVRQINTGEEGEYNPDNPVITCELGEPGSQLTSLSKKMTFYLNAKDYKGNWIDQSHIEVTCNGIAATLLYANDSIMTYELNLEEGFNTVMVRAWDEEGHETFYSYTVDYQNQHGGTIGEVTISVEATTIGSGYLVPETQVEITDGENVASAVTRVLSEYGFTAEHTGTVNSNFYLSRIRSENDFVIDNIPKDLEAHLLEIEEKDQGTYFPGSYESANSLGEYDFTVGSGWMYSVNGTYPNVGMAERILRPGDVIRLRFTLYFGADIGGADSLGNNMGKEGTKNWEKEW